MVRPVVVGTKAKTVLFSGWRMTSQSSVTSWARAAPAPARRKTVVRAFRRIRLLSTGGQAAGAASTWLSVPPAWTRRARMYISIRWTTIMPTTKTRKASVMARAFKCQAAA